MTDRKTVLVTDPLDAAALAVLEAEDSIDLVIDIKPEPTRLKSLLENADALIVRSGTKVRADCFPDGGRLKAIGRAGMGVDNIDIPAATERGIVVMNTPGGNSTTTAEHAIALMFAAARHVAHAHLELRQGTWNRKAWVGTELEGKTLGIVGLGNVGAIVASRGLGLGMRVLGFDPYVSKERANEMGIELGSFDEVVANADVLTIHVPKSERTIGLIGTDQLAAMKPTAILVNCARGGIVDEEALVAGLEAGEIASAAVDVFSSEPPPSDHPLLNHPKAIVTPHLGASTIEAQVKVGIAIAHQVVDFLKDGEIRNAVNAPSVSPEVLDQLGPYLELSRRLGRLVDRLHDDSVDHIEVRVNGRISRLDHEPIVAQALRGLLASTAEVPVNSINARAIADARGLIIEVKTKERSDFSSSVSLSVSGAGKTTEAAGSVFGKSGPRIVRINSFLLEAMPIDRPLVLLTNRDVPGVIGKVGTIFGDAGANISQMYVGRAPDQPLTLFVVALDELASEDLLAQLRAIESIETVRQVDPAI